jgi:hypothetical protein
MEFPEKPTTADFVGAIVSLSHRIDSLSSRVTALERGASNPEVHGRLHAELHGLLANHGLSLPAFNAHNMFADADLDAMFATIRAKPDGANGAKNERAIARIHSLCKHFGWVL